MDDRRPTAGVRPAPRVVVIGSGISGLAAAHRLLELSAASGADLRLTLLEAAERAGGIIATAHRHGFVMEAGPDAFLSSKPGAIELCRRLGLEHRLIPTQDANRRTFVVRGGRLVPVPDGFQLLAPTEWWPFFKSPLFTWRGKLRMAAEVLLPRGRVDGDESLASFVRRRLGREALERAAQPLVGGIYTADAENLSLAATMPQFLDMERRCRSVIRGLRRERRAGAATPGGGVRYSQFVSFREGMQTLIDELVRRLPSGCLRCGECVVAIRRDPAEGWCAETTAGARISADAVIVAAPSHAAAALLAEADAELGRELAAIEFASAATINLAYERDAIGHALDGFGCVVPAAERMTMTACTFSSIKFAGRAPAGQVLLRAFAGGAMNPEAYGLDDEALVAAVRAELQRLLDIRRAPRLAIVARWPRSMPQYPVGHLHRVARIRASLRQHAGLYLAGNAYGGVGIPDCVASGAAAAEAAWQGCVLRAEPTAPFAPARDGL